LRLTQSFIDTTLAVAADGPAAAGVAVGWALPFLATLALRAVAVEACGARLAAALAGAWRGDADADFRVAGAGVDAATEAVASFALRTVGARFRSAACGVRGDADFAVAAIPVADLAFAGVPAAPACALAGLRFAAMVSVFVRRAAVARVPVLTERGFAAARPDADGTTAAVEVVAVREAAGFGRAAALPLDRDGDARPAT